MIPLALASRSLLASLLASLPTDAPTFHETIEPLLQRHCQRCHHAGGAAPFPLESFDDARGYAPQIEEMVVARRMPPWGADPAIGRFANDPSLPQADLDAIRSWVAGGAKRGDPAKAPPRRSFAAGPSGFSLPEPPDLILTTATVRVPAEGTLSYEYVRLPTNLTEDRWVRAAEVRSTNPQVVHHVLAFLEEPRSARASPLRPWRPPFNQLELLQGAKPAERPLWAARFKTLIAHDLQFGEAGGLNGYLFSGLAGGGAARFEDDEGKFIPAGSSVVFQVHHQPNGKAAESATSLALWFAKEPRAKALDTRGVSTVVFKIAPNDANAEVRAGYRLPAAATLRSLQPHMHRRGKDFVYVARYPRKTDSGPGAEPDAPRQEEVLLRVPRYDFNWQHEYLLAEPKQLPAGTELWVTAHFDNSSANPSNPDPAQTVYFGLQTHEEMMIGYFEVVWDPTSLDEGE